MFKDSIERKYKKNVTYRNFSPLKEVLGPMTFFKVEDLIKLRKLAKNYKHEYKDQGGYFIDYSKYKLAKEYYLDDRRSAVRQD